MDKWHLKEFVETSKHKTTGWKSEGVIFEEAVQRCGSAVARGAVAVHLEGGLELYSFARSTTELQETMLQKNVSCADTPLTADMHEEIKAYMLKINMTKGEWTLQTLLAL